MEAIQTYLYFLPTVLQYGCMNATAPHLGMTASAISQAIRKLENHYGVKLLNRTTQPHADGRRAAVAAIRPSINRLARCR